MAGTVLAGTAAVLPSVGVWAGAVSTAGTTGAMHRMNAGSAGATMANESEWSRGRAALAIEWEQRPGRVEWTAAWIPGRAQALRPALRRAHVRQPGAAPSKVVRGCAAARQMPTSSRKVREKCRADRPAKARAPVAAPAEAWAAPGRRRQSASLTNRK